MLLALVGDSNDGRYTEVTSLLAIIVGSALGLALVGSLFVMFDNGTSLPNVFGSSRWATFRDLLDWGLVKDTENHDGLFLGKIGQDNRSIVYDGDMHALTVAPTRTGKGATAIIPNLLRSNSSMLVIDPKGENARRTVEARAKACDGRDSKVYVIDPWAVSTEADKYGDGISEEYLSGFNPLSFLDPNDPDLVTDVMMLAEALVIPSDKDPFWTEEAKALIYGIILYVITDEAEEGNRTLARVRDLITLPMAAEDATDLVGTFK